MKRILPEHRARRCFPGKALKTQGKDRMGRRHIGIVI